MRYCIIGCDVKERHSQSETECYPNLPSKLIRDEIDWITKTRAATCSKGSVVKPSGRENVAKKLKNKRQGLQPWTSSEVKSLHHDAVKKDQCRGPYSGASNMSKDQCRGLTVALRTCQKINAGTLQWRFEHVKRSMQGPYSGASNMSKDQCRGLIVALRTCQKINAGALQWRFEHVKRSMQGPYSGASNMSKVQCKGPYSGAPNMPKDQCRGPYSGASNMSKDQCRGLTVALRTCQKKCTKFNFLSH